VDQKGEFRSENPKFFDELIHREADLKESERSPGATKAKTVCFAMQRGGGVNSRRSIKWPKKKFACSLRNKRGTGD